MTPRHLRAAAMDRATLITLASELRGKAGVSIIRKHLREVTHDMLRAELKLPVLVLTNEWRVE